MSHSRRWLRSLVAATALFATLTTGSAQNQDRSPQQLWNDFNHYVLIARPDLAASSGRALLQQTDPGELLDVVEAGDYEKYEQTLDQAGDMDGVGDVAGELGSAINRARLERARDPERIRADIERLAEGQQAYANAITRLRAAGQAAVPAMLQTLTDDNRQRLQPYVTTALVAMGRPVVYPLSVALPKVDPPTQQRLARILARIGYPMPLPFLQQVIQDESTDPEVRRTLETAFQRLAQSVASGLDDDASVLYLRLGQDQYAAQTRGGVPAGYETHEGRGLVWRYNRLAGLVSIEVPEAIFGDVLAMQSARFALDLNRRHTDALRLWLMANLRRNIHLPDGAVDPTYGNDFRPPSFYALLAGPEQLLAILGRALTDTDAPLALAALEGLDATAATEALITDAAAAGPMLRGMTYPDTAVRFEAAAVMADARPESTYEGADLVVPALAEAVRVGGAKYALVLADSRDRAGALASALEDLGFDVIGGTSLGEIRDRAEFRPGVDLMLVEASVDTVSGVLAQTRGDYRLGATPVLAAVSESDRVLLEERAEGQPRLSVVGDEPDTQALTDAVDAALAEVQGEALTDEQARAKALRALGLLRDIGVGSSVYDLTLAEPALLRAVTDDRGEVAAAAAGVVAMLPSDAAQRALAEAAFDASGDRRVTLLNALADSATRFGNRLDAGQVEQLDAIIENADDRTAIAAARAHGALALPTQNAVEQVFGR